jgi:hypothetical protein
MSKSPPSVAEIVEALGGRRAVAKLCGVTYNAVANWCAWNAFPSRVHLVIYDECQKVGLDVPTRYFRIMGERGAA